MLLRTMIHLKMNHLILRLHDVAEQRLEVWAPSHVQISRPNQRIYHKLQLHQALTTNVVADASLHFFCLYVFCSANSNYKYAWCCLQAVQCLAVYLLASFQVATNISFKERIHHKLQFQ